MQKPRRLLSSLTLLGITSVMANLASTAEAQKPNVIIIYTDDLGYGDLGCYGAEGYETPHLDQMAKEGMRFTDFSTSSSICTPSRAGLLTGRYAKRWGHNGKVYFPDSKDGMPPSEITIAEMLKTEGYQTALVGKWHLGHQPEYLPTSQGFDYFFGIPYSNDMWHDPKTPLADNAVFREDLTRKDYLDSKLANKSSRNRVPLMQGTEVIEWPVDQAQLTRRYTEEALAFIRENENGPFFLYFAHAMPHIPLYASEQFKGKSEHGLFGDVIQEIDWSVGQLLTFLKERGLAENTLVVFTSDNGPWLSKKKDAGNAGPFRAGKMTDYEGGNRVPCIAWKPGTVPAGKVCNIQTSTLDMFPTIAALAGAELPSDRAIDGLDVSSILKGEFENAPQHDYHLYRSKNAIRVGDWKYVKGKKKIELFNLATDKGEKENLAKSHPEKVQSLAKKLTEVNAQMKPPR
ncbi:sulfatase family protein [Rubritalea sp.]|uniref:sulfatase family protein n=1 Tax=Rubritalea sp. TaxID=2109375 RepID=UPI003EF54C0F